jgi:hypothetical protein
MTGHPPRLALSLLRRWTSGPKRESLLGDLIEQHTQGRGRLWFWRQTGYAVLSHAMDDARHHAALVARSVVMSLLLIYALEWIALWLYRDVSLWVWNWSIVNDYDDLRIFWFGRPHWAETPRMFANCFVAFVVGVSVARTYRQHVAAAILAAAVALPLYAVPLKLWVFGLGYFGVAWTNSPAWFVVAHFARPFCLLMGGVLGTPDIQESSSGREVSSSWT